jgi:uncharacterized protein YhbP (UPF0306 family)
MARTREDTRRSALAYLVEHRVMTLATTSSQGPWAAAVFYASQEFELYFLSAKQTRHTQDLTRNPRVAATIQEDYRDWPDIKGIQLEGEVKELTGKERKEAIKLYQDKFPFIVSAGAQIQTALRRVSWFRLRPDLLYFIDNSLGLGHRDSIDLS